MLEKLKIEEIEPSTRRYPGIIFQPERATGDRVLSVENLSYELDGEVLFKDISFTIERGDKVVFLARENRAISAFFNIINGLIQPTSGTFAWGVNHHNSLSAIRCERILYQKRNLVRVARQILARYQRKLFTPIFGQNAFLGRRFAEKRQSAFRRRKNALYDCPHDAGSPDTITLDHPTNHLDMESIQAFNNNMKTFPGQILMTGHDHEFIESVCSRVIDLTVKGAIDKYMDFEDYLTDEKLKYYARTIQLISYLSI